MNWINIENRSIPDARWVKAVAEIRNNSTGEVREYDTDEVLEDGADAPRIFNWQENNFSCDCNREMFFEQVNGVELENTKCSDGKFSVNLKNKLDGVVYYREFEN